MKLLVFTADQRRHHALVRRLTTLGEVHVVGEVLPPQGVLGPAQTEYYRRMDAAERAIFPDPPGLPAIKGAYLTLGCNLGAASERAQAEVDVEAYDAIVVYGSSWLRPPLVDRLIAKRAINLHAGMAPYYRGTACNFWAHYDRQAHHVGCTIHLVARGLDNGDVLTWVPAPWDADPWRRGMRGLAEAMTRLVGMLEHGLPTRRFPHRPQSEIRYSRAADFTEAICAEYLDRLGVQYGELQPR